MMRLLAVLGAVSLLGQVILLRELTVAFFGSELIILLGLGFWLMGTGLGALSGPRRFQPRWSHLLWLLLAFGSILPGMLVLARGCRRLMGGPPGAFLPFLPQLLVMALILVPCAVLSGLMFQWAARLAVDRGRSLGAAYAAECAGALLGGAAATWLLAGGVGNFAQGMVCGLAASGAAVVFALGPRLKAVVAGGVVWGCVLMAALGNSSFLDRRLTAWNHPDLTETRDTPYGRITAEQRDGQVSLFINDALAYENQGTAAEEFVQLAALQCPRPRRILVLGGALSGILGEVRKQPAERIVYVEMNRILLDLMRDLPLGMGPDTLGPEPEIIVADPRRFLASARDFDLILVGMPEPASGQDNRFYTREFFTACARSLSAGGVLAFRVQGAENLWTPALARRAGSIHRALRAAFAAVVVMPGSFNIFMASQQTLPADAELPAARLQERGITARLITPGYLRYLYTNDRFAAASLQLAGTDAPANTDARPICYRQTLVLWLARFFPALGWQDLEPPAASVLVRSPWFWAAAAVWPAAALAARRKPVLGRSLAMAAAGAAGMILEAVLILDYQVRVGALYQDLGLLLCLFMLGMTLGAAAMARAASGRPSTDRLSRLPLLALPTVGLAVAWLIRLGALASLPATGLALAAAAAAVGMAFASLGRTAPDGQARLVPALLGADLLGSSLGSLAAGLILIPVWGLPGAALAAAVSAAGALLPLGRPTR